MSNAARSNIALIRSALDSEEIFDIKLDWYSNGSRGHLHGYARCYKMPKEASLIADKMSFNEAAKRVMCTSCFERSLMRVLPSLRELHFLISMRDRVSKGLKNPSLNAITCYNEMSTVHSYLSQLKNYEDSSMREGFYNLHRECSNLVKEYGEFLLNHMESSKSEIMGYAAKSLMENDSYYDLPEHIVTHDEAVLLCGNSRNFREVNDMYRRWLDSVVLNKFPVESFVQSFKSISLKNLSQLHTVDIIKVKESSESCLESAINNAWESARNDLCDTLMTRWGAKLDALLSRNDEVLVSINKRRISSNDELGVAIAAYSIAVNAESGTALLRCPRLIADWITKMGYLRDSSGGHIAILDDADWLNVERSVLETAVKLWDPHNDGVYKLFLDSLIAARNIHS